MLNDLIDFFKKRIEDWEEFSFSTDEKSWKSGTCARQPKTAQ